MLKRSTLLLVAACAALALTACSSNPAASVSFGDATNPGRITGVTGLESHDVANIATYGTYIGAKTTAPQKKVCSFTAIKGATMSFTGVESIECFAPETDTVAAPMQAKSAFERNTKAIGGLIQDSKEVALGVLLYKDRKNTTEANVQIETMRSGERQSNTAAMGALAGQIARDPLVITVQEGETATALNPQ